MSHAHLCVTCGQPVAICDGDRCQQEGDHYCTPHHTDPQFKAVDKPTVRMTVGIDPDQHLHIRGISD